MSGRARQEKRYGTHIFVRVHPHSVVKCLLPATHQCFRRPPKARNAPFVFMDSPSNQAHKIQYALVYMYKCTVKRIAGEVHLQWQQNCQHQQHDNVNSQQCTCVR